MASDDVVYAEFDLDERQLVYRHTVEPSGNSTIHVIVMDNSVDVADLRTIFEQIGCLSEGMKEKILPWKFHVQWTMLPLKICSKD